jgi:tRNA(fMet)-specific endonuclease VapC
VIGNEIALDTSVAVALLNNSTGWAQWVKTLGSVRLPVPVVGELRFGALNSQHATKNLRRVDKLVARCPILPIGEVTSQFYADVRFGLKRIGKPIPENDVWIAAICLEHRISLATNDGHFSAVDGLQVVGR